MLAPGPFLPTVLARAPASMWTGTATVALAGADGQWIVNDEPTKTFVLEADRVDHVVAVSTAGVAVVAPTSVRQVGSVDWSRRIFEVDVPSGGDVDAGRHRCVARARHRRARGRARRHGSLVVHTTIEYAKQRVQFDVPIGSFQAIQHKLANMSLAVERAVSATYYAAMAIDADDPTVIAPRTWPRRPPVGPPRCAPRTASRSTAASATRGSTTCTSTSAGRMRPSTCSARRAGTTTGWPPSSSTLDRGLSAPTRRIRNLTSVSVRGGPEV